MTRTYLWGAGFEDLTAAVNFIERGGTAEQAISLIAALAMLTPDRLYGRQRY
jgi:hypothetical protein